MGDQRERAAQLLDRYVGLDGYAGFQQAQFFGPGEDYALLIIFQVGYRRQRGADTPPGR